MRKLIMVFAMAVMAATLGFANGQAEQGLGGGDPHQAAVTMKIEHNLPTTQAWQDGFTYIKDEMGMLYPNLDCTIYPNGQLAKGDWKIIFEQAQSNVVQITCESQVTLATLVPQLFALSTPFLFDDMDHLLRFMDTNPDYVQGWFDQLEEKNLKVLTYWPRGPRQLVNSRRPVVVPEDIRGLKFRVPAMDLFITTFNAMGAKPVPMPSGEIYTGIQLGTVCGEDNSLQTVCNTKTYEQCRYMNVWNYMADGVLVVVNKNWYDGLPEGFRADLDRVAKESTQVMLGLVKEREVSARRTMETYGIQFTDFTAEMKEPWKAKMGPVYASVEKLIGSQAWAKLQAGADATREK
ncbi:TRAP transporter substrate-binding protein [Sediminispirochaeta bajacaliforniensis]|uniref:TRAP transporter substrate-binding protein n=1 Tax=Sediminispirochaeta bajacaliforniensis TaxID=148 RepID=UPI0003791327|nr:TRAP transporter substrate-binding protein [Sediminispirochaeta bajacaliforniensis]